MSSRQSLIKQRIHRTLEVFRYLFTDSDIITQIDSIYEEELMRKVDLISDDAADKVIKGMDVFIAFYKNLSFSSLSKDIETLGFPVNLKVDVFKLTINGVDDQSRIKNSKIRAAVVAIIRHCKPILDCFTLALSDPVKYLKKIGEADVSQYDSLL